MSLTLNDSSLLKSSVHRNDQRVSSDDNTTFYMDNSVTGEAVGTQPLSATSETRRAFKAASEALEYGLAGINEGVISNEMAPFGGLIESGQGREASKYGVDDYLEKKHLCMDGINS